MQAERRKGLSLKIEVERRQSRPSSGADRACDMSVCDPNTRLSRASRITYVAALMLSNTSRSASSRARAVSGLFELEPRLAKSSGPVDMARDCDVARRDETVPSCDAPGSGMSLITPVECHVGVLNRNRVPPSRGLLLGSCVAAPGESCWWPFAAATSGLSRLLEERAWRRVMLLRMRRISSTSWIPSGFFLKRYWSRCRPKDDDVKAW